MVGAGTSVVMYEVGAFPRRVQFFVMSRVGSRRRPEHLIPWLETPGLIFPKYLAVFCLYWAIRTTAFSFISSRKSKFALKPASLFPGS